MKNQTFSILLFSILSITVLTSFTIFQNNWIIEKHEGYALCYTDMDRANISEYQSYFEKGKTSVEKFFSNPFKTDFSIYIHPSRKSLDSTWQKNWNMPNFKSQCWMVASGVSNQLDIISPKKWESLACEHIYSDSTKTQNLITHELVHVYHGQYNVSPDFSDVVGIDWFVEGLAVYASGQCDSIRIKDVKSALSEGEIPEKLANFWSGKLKYGLSGTLVMYLDKAYGREQLISLLTYNNLKEITETLGVTEDDMLSGWKTFMDEL
ncbi:hypothetical protein [Winogradskyella sp.]|uniref:hypothetical protein n=1 Tax=Winogradskyella sp. TaxID=1883156 RepID=UPI00263999F7|nr:hypothetical protein [Winogradskyella sp.]